MAPKKTPVAKKASQVKHEAADADPLCVNGKRLSNEFSHKLKRAPSAVRRFYEGTLKSLKINNPEKKKLVEEVMSTSDFRCEYFEQLHTFKSVDSSKETNTWTVSTRPGHLVETASPKARS